MLWMWKWYDLIWSLGLNLTSSWAMNTCLAVEFLHHSGYFRVVAVEDSDASGMDQLFSLPFDAV